MDLDGEWQQGAFVLFYKFPERDLGHRILASPSARVRKTGEADPWKRGAMYARVVFMPGTEFAVAAFDLIDSSCRALHEFREAFSVIKIYERERFIRQDDGGAAVDHVMDQHLALA